MNKKSVGKQTKPNTSAKPRRIRAATLLKAATLAAAVLVAATDWPKLPPSQGN
jgi:hypothetical protein